ncbi:sensor histidine kinase [Hyunsoonleella sp. 2307UL5-6]|uniref:sensor histidine kinase n=1 Tax=Hyunsoonleella sp. 2307UL5-6 TaxID=3384768 RepID=UPI0039BD1328
MKIVSYLLVFLFLGVYCYAQDIEVLPAQPWERLVEMNSNKKNPIRKWGDSIHVGIEGLYKTSDSLLISKIVKKLDSITKTASIQLTNMNKSNLKIKFLDTYIKDKYNPISTTHSKNWYNANREIYRAELYIYIIEKTDLEIKNELENKIAGMLVEGYLVYPSRIKKRESIFNPITPSSLKTGALNSGDMSIIKEVYKEGFKKRLQQANLQFSYIIDDIENNKIRIRDRSLWWVKNPIAVIFLPALILGLFFLIITIKINNLITSIIKTPFLKLFIIAFISFFFLGILMIFAISLFGYLTIPNDYSKVPYVRGETIQFTLVAMLTLFSYLIFFRFMELKIRESSQNILLKTGWIFLSTGFLPFLLISGLVFIILAKKEIQSDQEDYTILSYIFLVGMVVASLRALISYFIFKERNLIVENETKLSKLRELKSKAELKSLQSQINPHFLYNSLNSIASLAPIDAVKTQKMAHSLSDLFKYSINRKGKEMSTVKDEIEMVTSYLNIEKIRFGNRLQFNINVDETLLNHEIPLFLIQPLVENAVKHGVSQNEGEGNISLNIEKEANQLVISVSDNGPDFPEGLVSGHGLQTVYDLLRLSYGDKAAINWTNIPEKVISITIPDTV